MTFTPGEARVLDSAESAAQFSRAMRKTGRPVVLVPLGTGLHAGHITLIRAARQFREGIVMVAWAGDEVPEDFTREKVDAVWHYSADSLWPEGIRTLVTPVDAGLEPVAETARQLTGIITLLAAVGPSDAFLGEKDYEVLQAVQHAVTDLHLPVQVHSLPTLRTADGLAISMRNQYVDEAARESAVGLSAALTAGAHLAEQGEEVVLDTAHSVLEAAGITPEYLAVRGLDLGPAPKEGDARLLVAATIGGVRLTDNVGLPIGIGFRNIEATE